MTLHPFHQGGSANLQAQDGVTVKSAPNPFMPQPPMAENRNGRPQRSVAAQPTSEDDGILAFFNSYAPPPDQMPHAAPQPVKERAPPVVPDAAAARNAAQRRRQRFPANIRANPGTVDDKTREERLAVVRRTPVNDSPANLTGESTFLPERRADARFTVILDIDNTLVHATPDEREADFEINVIHEQRPYTYYVSVRPFVENLFQYLRENREFEVIIFTAAQAAYGKEIIRHLDPTGSLGRLFLSSEHTTQIDRKKIKDLALLGRPIESMIIVEDNPDSFIYQRRSSFPISQWVYTLPNDSEILDLMRVLDEIRTGDRGVLEVLDNFKVNQLNNESFNRVLGPEEER